MNPKKKKPKGSKNTTIEIIHDLWNDKHTVAEIASIRKLSETTIYGHFVKLIEQKDIFIEDVFSEEKTK